MSDNGDSNAQPKHENEQHSHNDLYHWTYAVGATILLGICDFAFFYPESHLGAFLILAGWISLVAVYELHKFKYGIRSIGASIAIIFMMACLGSWLVGPIPPPPPPPPIIGWLEPANAPTPDNPCGQSTRQQFGDRALLLIIGNVGIIGPMLWPLRLGGCQMTMSEGPDGIAVDIDLFDQAGDPIGSIRNNKYTINPESRLVTQGSGDLSTLVVHDQTNGAELFYVRFMNANTIRIRGVLSCPRPRLTTISITNSGIIQNGQNFARDDCIAGFPIGLQIP